MKCKRKKWHVIIRGGWDYDLLIKKRILYRILQVLTKSPCCQYSSGFWNKQYLDILKNVYQCKYSLKSWSRYNFTNNEIHHQID